MSPREHSLLAVVGATGAVGSTMVRVLSERGVAASRVVLLASPRSEGGRMPYGDTELPVRVLDRSSFRGVATALFALDDALAEEWVPFARQEGVTVVDNSATFRLHPEVPLVVPEVNGQLLDARPTLVANPNCSTIVLVLALAPLARAAGLRRVHGVTFQSASGAGAAALAELRAGSHAHLEGDPEEAAVFRKPLAFNCLPEVGSMRADGHTREEWKMREESRKILALPELPASFTCVRVPSFIAHAVAMHIELERPLGAEEARTILASAAGILLGDGRDEAMWPTPRDAAGRDEVFVGRLRNDPSVENGLQLWAVGDNLRKGAATNAIQIAEILERR